MKINTKNVTFNKSVTESGDFQNIFCKNWKVAAAALEVLKNAIKNPIVKLIIGIVIDAGNSTYASTCGATAAKKK